MIAYFVYIYSSSSKLHFAHNHICLVNDNIWNPIKHILYSKNETLFSICLFNSSMPRYDCVKMKDDLKMQFELNANWKASCNELCNSKGNMQRDMHAQ